MVSDQCQWCKGMLDKRLKRRRSKAGALPYEGQGVAVEWKDHLHDGARGPWCEYSWRCGRDESGMDARAFIVCSGGCDGAQCSYLLRVQWCWMPGSEISAAAHEWSLGHQPQFVDWFNEVQHQFEENVVLVQMGHVSNAFEYHPHPFSRLVYEPRPNGDGSRPD